MKKVIKTAFILFALGMFSSSVFAGEGTLMGNSSGTEFCCDEGTNGCGAAECEKAIAF